jgi:hypothetical protein
LWRVPGKHEPDATLERRGERWRQQQEYFFHEYS